MTELRWAVGACLAGALAWSACGTTSTPGGGDDEPFVEEETSIDDDPIVDESGKADSVTKVVVVKGTVRNGSSLSGTLPANIYWAWKFTGKAGSSATASVTSRTSSRRPVAMIYGPRTGSGWGPRLGRQTASGLTAKVNVNLSQDGTYLLVLSESSRRSYAYSVSFQTASNACTLGGGTCQPLGPAGCPSGQHSGSAALYPCGPAGSVPLGVMCCLPGEANACESAGGQCKALTASGCGADAHPGDADTYSCGGGLGVQCCLPLCKPYCGAVGSRSEGWYDGCSGALIRWTSCRGQTATCKNIGSRSEGWYAGTTLIQWADCG